jgi:hypothetical protein
VLLLFFLFFTAALPRKAYTTSFLRVTFSSIERLPFQEGLLLIASQFTSGWLREILTAGMKGGMLPDIEPPFFLCISKQQGFLVLIEDTGE